MDGLQLYLDASNTKSYIGSGTTWNDISNYATNTFSAAIGSYTYPSIGGSNNNKYFIFVNNGTTVNNIYNPNTASNLVTRTQRLYTRIGWFYCTAFSSAWSPIIQNSIGNNSDMGLTVYSNGTIHFRQYWNTYTDGTTYGDYGVSSSGTVSTGRWNMAAIAVDLLGNSVTFYINGNKDSTSSINVIGNSNSNYIIIGGCEADSYTGDRMFKGYISSVMHYSRILSDTEILQIYNATKGRYGL
jgi:hypothetical protein